LVDKQHPPAYFWQENAKDRKRTSPKQDQYNTGRTKKDKLVASDEQEGTCE